MSRSSYGAVVLHVASESAVGGLLALVRDGDRIRLDVRERRLERRRAERTPPAQKDERGSWHPYEGRRLQANHGCASIPRAAGRPSATTPSRTFRWCRRVTV